MADHSVPMSAGFRRLLGLINGKRDAQALLAELPQLDAEDLDLWTAELLRQDFIAHKEELAPEEAAFSMTTEMPEHYRDSGAVDPGALIDSITATVSGGMDPAPTPSAAKKMTNTTRLAVIESVTSFKSVEGAGVFVYPDAAEGLPPAPRTCIATHEPALATLLSILVKNAGAQPVTVTSSAALLEALRVVTRPHVLFLDGDLPGINGFRALEAIRAKAALKNMRVILLSSQGERADLARALMLGATGFITKPLKREAMAVALPQIFGKR